ncbi:MAG: hypothetical protein FJ265_12310 [Planctomycetes bacterium]|nr:hypothetical protein [Planctomycetota bacterium]
MNPRDWPEVLALARAVLDRCDWPALGEIYFHWGGEAFWAERRPGVAEHGEALARRLLRELPRGGASLWAGAGVAELPVLLAEVLLHGREVTAANLRARECEVLNAAIAAVAPGVAVRYLPADAREANRPRAFDHLGCISLFTDPETWPLLSDVAYGRIAPVQIDVGQFVAEREQARELAAGLFGRLRRPGWITTTAEEVGWFLEQAERAGAVVDAGEDLVATAVVGDPVGVLAVR